MLPWAFQLYIAFTASFNFPREFIPKGQICPSCNSTHQSVFDNNHSAAVQAKFLRRASTQGPFPLSCNEVCSSKQIPVQSALIYRSPNTVTSPWIPMAVLLGLGGYFFSAFNIASDCSSLSLGNICTRFCTTNTAKPVSVFFPCISPSGTFTLTQNESLASQSFLATQSFEKWYHSHFREGLVAADEFLNCQIVGAMAHASSAHVSIQTAPGNSGSASPSSTSSAGKDTPVQLVQNTEGMARWLQSSHQHCFFPPGRVSLHCHFSLPTPCLFLSKLLIFFVDWLCHPVQKEEHLPCKLLADKAPSSIRTKTDTAHTSWANSEWANHKKGAQKCPY